MGSRKPPTLQQLAARHVGRLKGPRVVAFIVMWGIAEDALGHAPTLDEYADWWRESRSTVFREQARFREAFPGETTPQRLVDVLKAQEGQTWFKRGVSACSRISLSGDALIERARGASAPNGRLAS